MGKFIKIITKACYLIIGTHLPTFRNSYKGLSQRIRAFLARGFLLKRGKNVNIQPKATISNKVSIGDYSGIGKRCLIQGGTTIGNHVMMGPDVLIYTQNHKFSDVYRNMDEQGFDDLKEVHIGDNVWIGARVIILPGVNVGEGSVIGAGAVVSKDVPPFSVFVGNPGRVVKYRKEGSDID